MMPSPCRTLRLVMLGLLLLLCVDLPGQAQRTGDPVTVDAKTSGPKPLQNRVATNRQFANPRRALPMYRPPRRGAPRIRVNAGARGTAGEPMVYALASSELGFTLSATPVLYGYLAGPIDCKVEFALIIDDEPVPELEIVWDRLEPGLLRVDLAEWEVRLKTGIRYRWSIAMVLDPDSRSKDIVASGMIERITTPAELLFPDGDLPVRWYLDRGAWYDAVDAAITGWMHFPASRNCREEFELLLREAELADLAESFQLPAE